MNQKITIGVISIVVIAASFYGGMKFGQSQNTASAMQRGRGGFRGMQGGNGQANGMNGGFVSGEVLSSDGNSVTVKLKDGGSKIVFVSASTSVVKSDSGALADVSAGKQISVVGSANSDGSVTAQSIQIRPDMPAVSSTQPQGSN